jgi:hypothetical protein
MALKMKYKAQDDVPAELRSVYSERNGEFVLDVDGAVAVDELDRVQRSVDTLTHERTALQTQLRVARTEDAAVAAARLAGLKESAVVDLRNRARLELGLTPEGKPARCTPCKSTFSQ